MSFLLKILKGTNAGAEIALAEGPVTFGSGDGCDVVIADSTLPEEAFVIETAAEGLVTLKTLPDGEMKVLEPYTVFAAGGMEFVVGRDGEPWGTLRRPEPPKTESEASAEDADPVPVTAKEPPLPGEGAKEEPRGFPIVRTLIVLVLLLLCALVGWWLWLHRGDLRRWRAEPAAVCVASNRVESLDRIAADAGLELSEHDGRKVLRGNFVRRRDRMAVAARARAADRTAALDLSDDETLKSGVDETLFMLTGGRIVAASASNRCVRLTGTARTRKGLLDTVAALCADVNRLKTIDDTAVVCGDGLATPAPTTYRPVRECAPGPFEPAKPAPGCPAATVRSAAGPACPVAGLIVTPYPCLVLRDGSRACEGAVIAGWTVKRISAEGVLLRQGDREVQWKP